MSAAFKRVFVLLGPKCHGKDDRWVGAQLSELARLGRLPEPKVFRACVRRFAEVGDGARRVHVLRPQDAAAVYAAVHNGPTLAIAAPSVRVLLDPRRDPASDRTVCRPADVLRHKAVTWVVQDQNALGELLGRLVSPHPCDDVCSLRDPRLLPLHLFGETDVLGHLATAEGRRRFVADYRHRKSWVGDKGIWQDADPHARHGMARRRGTVVVSGWEVPEGHHWDVQAAKGDTELVGLNEVWMVKPGGHVNVFPDAALLGSHRAARVWSSP